MVWSYLHVNLSEGTGHCVANCISSTDNTFNNVRKLLEYYYYIYKALYNEYNHIALQVATTLI